jgi:hypothetical protein
LNRLRSQFHRMYVTLGERLKPTILAIAESFGQLSDRIWKMDDQTLGRWIKFFAALAAAGPVVLVLAGISQSLAGILALVNSIKWIGGAIGAILGGGAVTSVVLLTGAIAALGIALWNINKEVGEISFARLGNWFKGIWEWAGKAGKGLDGFFASLWKMTSVGPTLGDVGNWFKGIWEWADNLLLPIEQFFSRMWNVTDEELFRFLRNLNENGVSMIGGWFRGVWNRIGNLSVPIEQFFSRIWNITDEELFRFFRNINENSIPKMGDWFRNLWAWAGDASASIDKALVSMWNGKQSGGGRSISKAVSQWVDPLERAMASALDTMNTYGVDLQGLIREIGVGPWLESEKSISRYLEIFREYRRELFKLRLAQRSAIVDLPQTPVHPMISAAWKRIRASQERTRAMVEGVRQGFWGSPQASPGFRSQFLPFAGAAAAVGTQEGFSAMFGRGRYEPAMKLEDWAKKNAEESRKSNDYLDGLLEEVKNLRADFSDQTEVL